MKRLLLVSSILIIILPVLALAQSDYVLTAAEQKKLDTFFSNFSEAHVESFTQETLTEKTLLDFALIHCYINKFKSLTRQPDGLTMGVPAQLVDQATERYFGRTISQHAEKVYKIPLADGEAYTFSQINKMTPLGADRFKAEGFIYSTGSGGRLTHMARLRNGPKRVRKSIRWGSFRPSSKKSTPAARTDTFCWSMT